MYCLRAHRMPAVLSQGRPFRSARPPWRPHYSSRKELGTGTCPAPQEKDEKRAPTSGVAVRSRGPGGGARTLANEEQ